MKQVMIKILSLYAVYVLYSGIIEAKPNLIRTVQIKEYVGCNMKLPFHQEGVTVNITGRGYITLNGHLDIDEDIGNITMITVNVQRCVSFAERESSCEYFVKAHYDNPCPMINARGMFWTAAFDKVTPRMSCPFKKGVYDIHESTFDASGVSAMLYPGTYWRSVTKIHAGERLVSCFIFGVELLDDGNYLEGEE